MALNVDIALNAREFQATTKDVERDLENLSDVLEDFGTDAADAGREGEDALDTVGEAAKDAERKFRDLTDETDATRRELGRAEDAADDFGRAADDAGDKARRGMDRASEGVEEFKDEANSTAREAAASFDGSAESIADTFQEIAANAFAGFGPAGAVAGLAAAAGIGLAVAGFDAMNEAEQESRERASEWAAAYIEAGSTVLSAATQAQMAQDIITDPERWQEAQDNAREWGVSTAVAVAAMTGETWALAAANDSLTEAEAAAAEGMTGISDSGEMLSEMLQGATADTRNGREALDALNEELANGAIGAATYSETLTLMAQNTAGATHNVDEFGDSIYNLPDGTTVYVDAETGQATMNVDDIERRIYGIPDGNSTINVATGPVNSSSVANYIASRPSVQLTVKARTQAGIAIPV